MIGTLTLGRAERLQIWLTQNTTDDIDLRLEDAAGRCVYRFDAWRADEPDRFSAALPNDIALWRPDEPTLYRLVGRVGDTPVDQRVGFRWWRGVGNSHVEINGEPIYLRGVIRGITAHDHPNLTGASDIAWHEKSITQIKRFGMNFVRWHSTVPPDEYLDAADRLGFAVQLEIGFDKKDGQIIVDPRKWAQVIRDLCRHPSVAVYCVGNEIRRCGNVEPVQQLVNIARKLDPSALVMDNCGWGQPDRPNPDVYCQHVAYYFPFGEHERMFDYPIGFELEGFVGDGKTHDAKNPLRPTMAHEVCHYIAMRDFDTLRAKWQAWRDKVNPPADHEAAELPWWIEEIESLYEAKGLVPPEPQLRRASRAYQRLLQRHALESIRRSNALCGYEMLQQSDCWRYENSNALLDSFDDPVNWNPDDFLAFNGDTAITIDLPRRDLRWGEATAVGVHVSHFGREAIRDAQLTVHVAAGDHVIIEDEPIAVDDIAPGTNKHLADINLDLPAGDQPTTATLTVRVGDHETSWPLWLLPVAPRRDDARVVHDIDEATIRRVERGESLLWLYRPADQFDDSAPRPALDLEGRRDLFKGVIWDRGDNLGAVIREHPALGALPHDGYMDWQLAPLAHHGVKVNLDDFPVETWPIVQGVGRPVRDRMHAMKMGLKDIQPAVTFRRWGWLFELAIGKGRLLVCGLNLRDPSAAGDYLLGAMLDYLDNPDGEPSATIDGDALLAYMRQKGASPHPTEGPMTQYWLLDNQPVETVLFWEQLGIKLE
jgi:hypothetical protein